MIRATWTGAFQSSASFSNCLTTRQLANEPRISRAARTSLSHHLLFTCPYPPLNFLSLSLSLFLPLECHSLECDAWIVIFAWEIIACLFTSPLKYKGGLFSIEWRVDRENFLGNDWSVDERCAIHFCACLVWNGI